MLSSSYSLEQALPKLARRSNPMLLRRSHSLTRPRLLTNRELSCRNH